MSNRAKFEDLAPAIALASGAVGDFMELGVWRGDTFLPLAKTAASEGRNAHAVDSFRGMLAPSGHDLDERGRHLYPAGALSVGGPAELQRLTADMKNVRIHAGYIPQILETIKVPDGLALVHVDLDQYLPTCAALAWAWARINSGGVLICHDYWPGRGCLAALAIDEFLKSSWLILTGRNEASSHAWIKKEPRK